MPRRMAESSSTVRMVLDMGSWDRLPASPHHCTSLSPFAPRKLRYFRGAKGDYSHGLLPTSHHAGVGECGVNIRWSQSQPRVAARRQKQLCINLLVERLD